jgi:CheY-like chemotaxis protein/HPt (histidine-containing phosphotransfer) domain-containing protein
MRDHESGVIERLIRLGGEELVADLVALYVGQVDDRLAAARLAVHDRDLARLAELAHAIRSSSAQLGADDVVASCEDVEDASERGDSGAARESFSVLETRLVAFTTRLSERMTSTPPPAVAQQDPDSRAGMADGARPGHGVRQRIAVIEDNADNRLLVDAILGVRYALDEYQNGADALVGMERHHPDLILLDVSLPGMDGLDVLARVREAPRLHDVPVVAVTAHAMAGDRERYVAAGFDGYVPKPIIDEDVLINAVESLLSARRNGRGRGR